MALSLCVISLAPTNWYAGVLSTPDCLLRCCGIPLSSSSPSFTSLPLPPFPRSFPENGIHFCFIILILSSCSQHRNTPQPVLSWKSLFRSHLPQPLLLSLPLPFISQSSFLQRSSICCLYFLSFHSFLKPILTRSTFSWGLQGILISFSLLRHLTTSLLKVSPVVSTASFSSNSPLF